MKRNHLEYLAELARVIYFNLSTRLEQNPNSWIEIPEEYLQEKIDTLKMRFEELKQEGN